MKILNLKKKINTKQFNTNNNFYYNKSYSNNLTNIDFNNNDLNKDFNSKIISLIRFKSIQFLINLNEDYINILNLFIDQFGNIKSREETQLNKKNHKIISKLIKFLRSKKIIPYSF